MQRYLSPPLVVPARNELTGYDRVDLELNGVDHSDASFAVRVFLDDPEAGPDTPASAENARYAGSFYIFGHGPCLGDEGHCDTRTGPIHPYDLRPPHPLTAQYHRLPITTALRAVAEGETFTVTLIAMTNRGGEYQPADLLSFTRLSVVAYS